MAAATADGAAFGILLLGHLDGVVDAELLAAGEGGEQGEGQQQG